MVTEKCPDRFNGRMTFRSCRDHLHPIASRQDHGFLNAVILMQPAQSIDYIGFFKGDAFTNLDRRAPMIESDYDDFLMHGYSKRPPCRLGNSASPQRK